ncbi:MAG TPA: hypothetical protein VKE93_13540 [Candidatus Angelobacter sp.]|nr:hypothetical protein [Candidatus Angelobacter sp.]
MSFRKFILFRPCGVAPEGGRVAQFCWRYLSLAILLASSISAFAKDATTAAIVLFDGPKGAAYVQITGITINGKTELRVCDGVSKFDKRAYDSFARIQLTGATSLERGSNGVLTLTVTSSPVCVVPGSVKFEKNAELTPSDAAEQAVLQGTPVSASDPALGIPVFKPGVQLVLVLAPDSELADFLRARRANSDKDWQEYLSHYPSSTHAADARNGLAGLHQQAADAAFAQYQKLAAAHKPDLAPLKHAFKEAQTANQAAAGYSPAVKLMETISHELDTLLEQDRTRLQTYQKALQNHTEGFAPLLAARQHVEQLLEVRPEYAPLLNLRREILSEEKKVETAVTGAENSQASGRYDEALASLGPYSVFAGEAPRIDAVVTAAYRYHFNRGQELAAQRDWETATAEFRKAVEIRGNSEEASAALKNATAKLTAARNQQAADRAVSQSKDYAAKKDFIEAYNVLASLSDAQRALVTEQVSAVSRDYVAAASRRAMKLQEIHIPIKGRADEDALHEAYVLLDHASSLSGDPAMTLKRDFLSSKISAYYMEQAKRYLDKPSGSGAGVGWMYLKEAQRYAITPGAINDQMARYAPLYQRRARLSVGIVLRDQTSRRNSAGFADQMTDAIATGLESSGVSVELVRKPAEASDGLQPNFMFVGEILEHRVVKNANLETLPSKYRAGTHEVKNPAWLQASSDFEAAKQQLVAAQRSLADAQAQHKKKEIIAAANDAVQQAQQHAGELQHKLETTDQNHVEPILEPYQYNKKTVDLSATIDLAFRINDPAGSAIEPAVAINKDKHKSAVVLENVKPEDAQGITNQSVEPDDVQFLTDLEIEARDALVKAVQEKAGGLAGKILQEARNRAHRDDMDAAGEEYVLYLNATPAAASPEREEAVKFLHDQFNLTVPAASKL